MVRTIVVNCDRGWPGWPNLVRTYACDLYPLAEKVSFWDAVTGTEPSETVIWGGWPRSFLREPRGVFHELVEHVAELDSEPADAKLAIVVLYGGAQETLRSGEDTPRCVAESPLDAARLKRLRDEFLSGSDDNLGRRSRVWRIGVFRAPARGVAQLAPFVDEALRSELLDNAVFLTPPGQDATVAQRAGASTFLGLRLLVDAARDESIWSRLRRDQGGREARTLRLEPPPGVQDPGTELRAAFLAFVDDQKMVGAEGVPIRPLEALGEAVEQLRQEVASVGERSQAASALADNAPVKLPELPSRASLSEVDAWCRRAETALRAHFDTRRDRNKDDQATLDQLIRVRENAITDAADRISAANLGLAGHAFQRLARTVSTVVDLRNAYVGRCRGLRAQLQRAADRERRVRASDRPAAPFAESAAYRDFEQGVTRWRAATIDVPARTPVLCVVAALLVLAYGMLVANAVAAQSFAGQRDVGSALLLDLSPWRWGLWALVAALFVGSALLRLRLYESRWRSEGVAVARLAERVGKSIDETSETALSYSAYASGASHLEPIERRLRMVARDHDRAPFDRAVSALRGAGGAQLGEQRRLQLLNVLRPKVAGSPVSGWVRSVLATWNWEDPRPIVLTVGDRTLEVSSRLRADSPLALRPAGAGSQG